MSNSAKKEYLHEIRKRYFLVSRSEKILILDEFCAVCGLNRKYVIRLIKKKETTTNPRNGRHKKYYSAFLLDFLKYLWVGTNLACSKRLKAAIPLWLPYYHTDNRSILSDENRKLLLEIPPRTIDRLLHRLKSKYKKLGLSTTKPDSLLKKQVPIKLNQWDESRPGFIEADTVAHCGSSLSVGQFVYTLNIVDIASGWTEQRALWGKGQRGVFEALKNITKHLPFKVLGFDCDNGGELLNYMLLEYLLIEKILFNILAQENTRKTIMLTLKKRTGLMFANLLDTRDLTELKPLLCLTIFTLLNGDFISTSSFLLSNSSTNKGMVLKSLKSLTRQNSLSKTDRLS